jgi:hypothetical protein
MKKLKFILQILFLSVILSSFNACVVVRDDNGRHIGWFKKHHKHHRTEVRTIEVRVRNHPENPALKLKKNKPDKKSKKNQWDAKK